MTTERTLLRPITFEFRVFPADEHGAMDTKDEFTETRDMRDVGAAKGYAGTLARKHKGPVDVAYAGDEPWDERYLTTAKPHAYTKSGFSFERLDG